MKKIKLINSKSKPKSKHCKVIFHFLPRHLWSQSLWLFLSHPLQFPSIASKKKLDNDDENSEKKKKTETVINYFMTEKVEVVVVVWEVTSLASSSKCTHLHPSTAAALADLLIESSCDDDDLPPPGVAWKIQPNASEIMTKIKLLWHNIVILPCRWTILIKFSLPLQLSLYLALSHCPHDLFKLFSFPQAIKNLYTKNWNCKWELNFIKSAQNFSYVHDAADVVVVGLCELQNWK